jgi:hypothetical protein
MAEENIDKGPQIGRLAMRREGEMWVAYYAQNETMDRAVVIGSILMRAVESNPGRKDLFMDMMRDIITEAIESETGARPTWGGPQLAPEHERSGKA